MIQQLMAQLRNAFFEWYNKLVQRKAAENYKPKRPREEAVKRVMNYKITMNGKTIHVKDDQTEQTEKIESALADGRISKREKKLRGIQSALDR